MATPQEIYDETKTRLDLNIAKAQMLEREIKEKLSDVVTETVETVESK